MKVLLMVLSILLSSCILGKKLKTGTNAPFVSSGSSTSSSNLVIMEANPNVSSDDLLIQSGTTYTPSWTSISSLQTLSYSIKACAGATSNCSSNCLSEVSPALSGLTVLSGLSDGTTYTICVKENYRSGLSSNWVAAEVLVKIDNTAPYLETAPIGVPSNQTYSAGTNLDFIIPVSETIIVDETLGTPSLALNIGGITKYATYLDADSAAGDVGSNLRFRYTVENGLSDSDGIVVASSFALNGATIKDYAENALAGLSFTLPLTTGILVNSSSPQSLGSITIPTGAYYVAGDNLDFIIHMTEAVTVNSGGGTPRIQLDIGGTTKYASYLDMTSSDLRFRYTVEAGLTDFNGVGVTSSLDLNGGIIRNASLVDMSPLTLSIPSTAAVLVDAVAPQTLGNITLPTNTTHGGTEDLDFYVHFTEAVVVSTAGGTPRLELDIGGTTKYATYFDTSSSDVRFRYTLETGLSDSNGIGLTNSIDLNGGSIKDVATNSLSPLTFTSGSTASILIDSLAPSILGAITLPANDTYIATENLDFILDFDQTVDVTGSPRLVLNIGGVTKYATSIDTAKSSLTFRYTVESSLLDLNGIGLTTTLDLNSGSIKDIYGNSLSSLVFASGSTASILVDSIPPYASGDITLPADQYYGSGAQLDFLVNMSETSAVNTGGGTPRLQLDVGGLTKYATYQNASGDSLIFRYTVENNLIDTNGISLITSILLNGGTIYDLPTNNMTPLTFTSQSLANIKVDSKAPSLPSSISPLVQVDQTIDSYTPTWTDGTDDNSLHHELKACKNVDCSTDCLATANPAVSGSDTLSGLGVLQIYRMCVRAVDSLANASSWVPSASVVSIVGSFINYLDVKVDGVGGADGISGLSTIYSSPDGRNLYASAYGENAIGVYTRDINTGLMTYLEKHTNGVGGVDGVMQVVFAYPSPDGRYVYGTAMNTGKISMFSRNMSTGALSYLGIKQQGVGGIDGLNGPTSVGISPDGRFLYSTGYWQAALAVFSRDLDTGNLTYVEVHKNGVGGVGGLTYARRVLVSPDGLSVYATGVGDDSIVIFSRNIATGTLTFVGTKQNGVGGVSGLDGVLGLVISPDGNYVYSVAQTSNAMAVFSRDPATSALTFLEVQQNGVGGVSGIAGATAICLSPDGQYIYVSGANDNALAVFSRSFSTGLTTFVGMKQQGVGGFDGLTTVIHSSFSPDGKYLYSAATGSNSVGTFILSNRTGELTYIQEKQNGVGGVSGLAGAYSTAFSPDGKYLYVASMTDNALAVFSRDVSDGTLTYLEMKQDGVGGVDGLSAVHTVSVSSDGKNVYAASYGGAAVSVFSRDILTGLLTYVEVQRDGVGGVDGLLGTVELSLSPDGRHLYSVGIDDSKIAVFSRNTTTGALTYVEMKEDGVGGVDGLQGAAGVTVSPDGLNVYVAGTFDHSIATFTRNVASGVLTYLEIEKNGVGGVSGLSNTRSVTVAPDGRHVYATGPTSNTLVAFSRDPLTGALTFVEKQTEGVNGVSGLSGARWVRVSPDNLYVYVASYTSDAISVFSRNLSSGALTYIETKQDGVGGVAGLDSAFSVNISPDGRFLYSTGSGDNAVSVFSRGTH